MKDTEYAFAAANIRAYETKLLTRGQVEQMINAANAAEVTELLANAGYPAREMDADAMLSQELQNAWALVNNLAPDAPELKLLVMKNDYQNLKTALKAAVTDQDPTPFYVSPCLYDPKQFSEKIKAKAFDELDAPKAFCEAAEAAYALLMRTMDGQLLDANVDKAALLAMVRCGEECESALARRYAVYLADMANIKTAYRAAKTKKSRAFLLDALACTENLNDILLADAASKGADECLAFLDDTVYAQAAAMLRISDAAFEKYADDGAITLVSEAKLITFGVEPLFAYYAAKENELRAIRIILVCKESGASIETITERMRELYV